MSCSAPCSALLALAVTAVAAVGCLDFGRALERCEEAGGRCAFDAGVATDGGDDAGAHSGPDAGVDAGYVDPIEWSGVWDNETHPFGSEHKAGPAVPGDGSRLCIGVTADGGAFAPHDIVCAPIRDAGFGPLPQRPAH